MQQGELEKGQCPVGLTAKVTQAAVWHQRDNDPAGVAAKQAQCEVVLCAHCEGLSGPCSNNVQAQMRDGSLQAGDSSYEAAMQYTHASTCTFSSAVLRQRDKFESWPAPWGRLADKRFS